MHAVLLLVAPLLISWLGLDLGLPPQPDLDLPVVPEHYDPENPAPGPVPPSADADDPDDPRDEPVPIFFGEERMAARHLDRSTHSTCRASTAPQTRASKGRVRNTQPRRAPPSIRSRVGTR